MKIKYILLIGLICNVINTSAQKIYTTKEGHILIMSQVDNQNVKAESHNLSLSLNYTTKEVKGTLDFKTLITKFKSINEVIDNNDEPLKVHFTGTIPVFNFMEKDHEPFNFNWPITITYQNKSFKAQLKAIIHHIDEGRAISCLLSAKGEIDISNTELENIIPGLDQTLQIQFSQLLLRIE